LKFSADLSIFILEQAGQSLL